MKLYYFNPNDHDIAYTVMANNEDEAKQSLLNHLKEKAKECPFGENINGELYESYRMILYYKWLNAIKKRILPDDYNIIEYNENQVIETEIG